MSKKKNPAYSLGYTCFKRGALDNPYKHGTYMYKEWQRGFDAAYMNNLNTGVMHDNRAAG
jgi:hypothetical protein